MDFAISTADEKDIEEIKAINEACLPENYPLDVYHQLYRSTLVAREKNKSKIAGYLMMANLATLDSDLEPFSRTYNEKKIHTVVFSLAVLPEYRKKGVGTRLLKIVCDSHKQYPVILHARKSNLAAHALYNKFGFKVLKESPGYYHNPDETGLVMVYLKGKNKALEKHLNS